MSDPDNASVPTPRNPLALGALNMSQTLIPGRCAQEAGRLQERLGLMGQGAVARLAASEALALGWWAGGRLTADRLALWMSFRLGATGADGGAMTRLSWVARRLAAGPVRQEGCDAAALLGLAGRFRVWAARLWGATEGELSCFWVWLVALPQGE
jgi:hypothetical protein